MLKMQSKRKMSVNFSNNTQVIDLYNVDKLIRKYFSCRMEQRTPKMSNKNMIVLLVMIHTVLFMQSSECGENVQILYITQMCSSLRE